MNSNSKTKILFVHSQLVQHGSERYLFELCKNLNKDEFEIHVLTRFFSVKKNFYYPKLIEIGCIIHTRLISLRHLRYPIKFFYNNSQLVKGSVKLFHKYLTQILYGNFFRKFDVIAVIGIETYCDALSPLLDNFHNVIVHNVFHQFQFERNYFSEFNQNKIVVCDQKQRDEILNSELSDIILYDMPLPMTFDENVNIGSEKIYNNGFVRVGIFSRLSKDRPNEPLFRCFAEFSSKYNSNTELYFYGDGDVNQYDDILEELKISETVFFQGHSQSISDSILRDKIDILWLVSMGKSISYSSIEISCLGMPMVFWNIDSMDYSQILIETGGSIHSFNNLNDFADFNCLIAGDHKKLRYIGQMLRQYVINFFDIKKNIKNLEKFYQENTNKSF